MDVRQLFAKFVRAFESSECKFGGEQMCRIGVSYRREVTLDTLTRWIEKNVPPPKFEFITMVSRLVYDDGVLLLSVELAGNFSNFERVSVFVNEHGDAEAILGLDTDLESPLQVMNDMLIFAYGIKKAPTFPYRYVLR